MNSIQSAFVQSKADLANISNAAEAEAIMLLPDTFPLDPDEQSEEDEEMYASARIEAEEKVGYNLVFGRYCDASKALIEWAHRVVCNAPEYSKHRTQLEPLFRQIQCNAALRIKVIDIALKMKG